MWAYFLLQVSILPAAMQAGAVPLVNGDSVFPELNEKGIWMASWVSWSITVHMKRKHMFLWDTLPGFGLYVAGKSDCGFRTPWRWPDINLCSLLVTGLCGSYNNKAEDDFMSSENILEKTSQAFANSWAMMSCPSGTPASCVSIDTGNTTLDAWNGTPCMAVAQVYWTIWVVTGVCHPRFRGNSRQVGWVCSKNCICHWQLVLVVFFSVPSFPLYILPIILE